MNQYGEDMRNQYSYIANDSLKIKIRSLSYFVSLILNFIFQIYENETK